MTEGREGVADFLNCEGVLIDLSRPEISTEMAAAFRSMRFERAERRTVEKTLHPGHRVLEMGTCTGYLAMVIGRIIGETNIFCYEANPKAAALAKHHFSLNHVAISITTGILVPRSTSSEMEREVEFFVAPQLVSSSLTPRKNMERVRTPVLILEDEIARNSINFIVCDIEGAEVDVLQAADLSGIDGIIMEEHPRKVGEEKTARMQRHLAQVGFVELATHRLGDVAHYTRVS